MDDGGARQHFFADGKSLCGAHEQGDMRLTKSPKKRGEFCDVCLAKSNAKGEGWAFACSGKPGYHAIQHYFRDGRSLCGHCNENDMLTPLADKTGKNKEYGEARCATCVGVLTSKVKIEPDPEPEPEPEPAAEPTEGWGVGEDDPVEDKVCYFRDGRSLCGEYVITEGEAVTLMADVPEGRTACEVCKKALGEADKGKPEPEPEAKPEPAAQPTEGWGIAEEDCPEAEICYFRDGKSLCGAYLPSESATLHADLPDGHTPCPNCQQALVAEGKANPEPDGDAAENEPDDAAADDAPGDAPGDAPDDAPDDELSAPHENEGWTANDDKVSHYVRAGGSLCGLECIGQELHDELPEGHTSCEECSEVLYQEGGSDDDAPAPDDDLGDMTEYDRLLLEVRDVATMTATKAWKGFYTSLKRDISKHSEEVLVAEKSRDVVFHQAAVKVIRELQQRAREAVDSFNDYSHSMPLFANQMLYKARWNDDLGIVEITERMTEKTEQS